MKLVPFFTLTAAGLWPLSAAPLTPGSFITAPYGPNGTWNLYQTSKEPLTWVEAQELAEKTEDPGGGTGRKGHLVVISSAAENMFVYQYAQGTYLWIGLTDHERWGGKEAGADRLGGWRWVNGEPYTWSAWRSAEPNESPAGAEDGAVIQHSGRWSDWGIGIDGQKPHKHPFMIEWDTQLPQPVPGVQKIGRVLPEKWPVDLTAWKGPVVGQGLWRTAGQTGLDGTNLRTVIEGLIPALEKKPDVFGTPRLNYRWPGKKKNPGGWVDVADRPLQPLAASGCGSLHAAKVHLDTPGTWSFNVHGDDFFAVRFPGLKWKSVSGMGGLDPLDAETVYFDTLSGDGRLIGVIDLPAGDHTLEVVSGNRANDVMLQLLAAPGEFTMDGATDRWRFPGHKAKEDLAWPGVDDKGWKVTRIEQPADAKPFKKFEDAITLADNGKATATGDFDSINFIDSDAAGDVRFPSPVPFPGDQPGNQDNYVIKAEATLVIPRDGIYHIGIHGEDHCGLCIVGEKWSSIIRDTGYNARMVKDTLGEGETDLNGANAQVVGEISLTKGTYRIEAVRGNFVGPSALSVFGGPAGYAPRLLTKGGAKIEPDINGLPLVEAPK